jgi:hypothetical protein
LLLGVNTGTVPKDMMSIFMRTGKPLKAGRVKAINLNTGRITNTPVEAEQAVQRLEHQPDAFALDDVEDFDSAHEVQIEAGKLPLRRE